MVGLIPLLPVASIPEKMVRRGQSLGKRFASFMESMQLTGEGLREGGYITGRPGHQNLQLSVVPPAQLGQAPRRDAVRGRVPVAARVARAVEAAPRRSRSSSSSAG